MRRPRLDRRVRVAIDWRLDFLLQRDMGEINVRGTRTRPGEDPAAGARGEPVSVVARPTYEELSL